MAPSLCGSFLTNKRSLVAFTWTLTTVFTLLAFVASAGMMIHLHTQYKRMEHYYEEQYLQNQYEQQQEQQQQEGEEEEEQQHSGSQDEYREQYEAYMALASLQSGTMTFAAIYTMVVALGLSLYGTTAIVGFTSLRGDYIAPCFSSGSSNLKLGIFGGAVVFFANLLLVCAVIFGEVRVEGGDRDDRKEGEGEEEDRDNDREPYEVERIATVLAVTCMFLSALYSIFAILLFLFYGNKDARLLDEEEDVSPRKQPTLPAIANDPRRENFITMAGVEN